MVDICPSIKAKQRLDNIRGKALTLLKAKHLKEYNKIVAELEKTYK